MSVAFILLSMGLGVLALAGSQRQLLIAAAIVAVGAGILHPLLIAVHMERVPSIQHGRASAVFYLGFDLGIGLGAWILSPAFQWLGLTGLYLIAAITAFVGVLPARLAMPAATDLQPEAAMTTEAAGHS